jgi:hypothetical protein
MNWIELLLLRNYYCCYFAATDDIKACESYPLHYNKTDPGSWNYDHDKLIRVLNELIG